MPQRHSATIVLRWGLAFVFFYAAISSLLHPTNWTGFVPESLSSMISPGTFLAVFAFYELILSAWLFSGRRLRLSSRLAILTLALIILANLDSLSLIFTDVGLLFSALALYDLAKEETAR